VASDQAAHGVADEDELSVARPARRPPGLQPLTCLAREPPRGDSVVAPPVVREFEDVSPPPDVERLFDVPHHLRIAVDLPEAGDQVNVPDDLWRGDPVAEIVDLWRVPLELQVADAPTERAQRAEHSPAGDVPYVLAVLPKDAPRDSGDTDDDVAHQLPRHETSSRLTSTDGQRTLRILSRGPGTGSQPAPARRQTLTTFL